MINSVLRSIGERLPIAYDVRMINRPETRYKATGSLSEKVKKALGKAVETTEHGIKKTDKLIEGTDATSKREGRHIIQE